MEEDFLLHAERLGAHQQRIERTEHSVTHLAADMTVARLVIGELQTDVVELKEGLAEVRTSVGEVQKSVGEVHRRAGKLEVTVGKLAKALESAHGHLGTLASEFREYARHTRTYHDVWASERKRNLRTLDLIQTSMLTSGVETEARFDRLEQRLEQLEDGAA